MSATAPRAMHPNVTANNPFTADDVYDIRGEAHTGFRLMDKDGKEIALVKGVPALIHTFGPSPEIAVPTIKRIDPFAGIEAITHLLRHAKDTLASVNNAFDVDEVASRTYERLITLTGDNVDRGVLFDISHTMVVSRHQALTSWPPPRQARNRFVRQALDHLNLDRDEVYLLADFLNQFGGPGTATPDIYDTDILRGVGARVHALGGLRIETNTYGLRIRARGADTTVLLSWWDVSMLFGGIDPLRAYIADLFSRVLDNPRDIDRRIAHWGASCLSEVISTSGNWKTTLERLAEKAAEKEIGGAIPQTISTEEIVEDLRLERLKKASGGTLTI
jgi:hypothetical protein